MFPPGWSAENSGQPPAAPALFPSFQFWKRDGQNSQPWKKNIANFSKVWKNPAVKFPSLGNVAGTARRERRK
jgi:hypothetical protein